MTTIEQVARDIAREYLGDCMDGSDDSLRMAQAAITAYKASEEFRGLVDAAQAVVKRWDTPLWKEVPHTAEYIHTLREALSLINT